MVNFQIFEKEGKFCNTQKKTTIQKNKQRNLSIEFHGKSTNQFLYRKLASLKKHFNEVIEILEYTAVR